MSKSAKLGSLIALPLKNGSLSYLHFIGPGIYGDAVRVLDGIFLEPMEASEVVDLAAKPERYIAQSFVGSVIDDIPNAKVVAILETSKSWDIAPWWVVSPAAARLLDRWVVSFDGDLEFQMPEFLEQHPDIDAQNLPETDVVGHELLQEMIQSVWRPRYGNFLTWVRSGRRTTMR